MELKKGYRDLVLLLFWGWPLFKVGFLGDEVGLAFIDVSFFDFTAVDLVFGRSLVRRTWAVLFLIDLGFDPDLLDLPFKTCSSACEAIGGSSSELKTIGLFCLFEGRESIPGYSL